MVSGMHPILIDRRSCVQQPQRIEQMHSMAGFGEADSSRGSVYARPGNRDLHVKFLSSLSWRWRRCRYEHAFANVILAAPPGDRITRKACQPNTEGDGIPRWY